MTDTVSRRDPWALTWIILASTLVMVPHITRIPPWLSLLFFFMMAWRWVGNHRNWYLPGGLVRFAFMVSISMAVFKEFGTLLGRDAGTGLLVALAGLKFLELRGRRDYIILTFILYLLVGIDFLYDQTLIHGAYLAASVWLITATLTRINLPTTDDWSYSLKLAGGLLLRALPLVLVLYVLFPRIQGGLWGLPSDAHAGLTGMSETMSPGSISGLAQSEAPAFRVEFDGDPPPPDQRYWRAMIMWNTDGHDWTRGVTPYLPPNRPGLRRIDKPVTYTVTLEPSGQLWLPALDMPTRAEANSRLKTGNLVESRSPVKARMRYTLTSFTQYQTGALTPYERALGLGLPGRTSDKVRALAQQWRKEEKDALGVANRALKYFNTESFYYTLNPPVLRRDPVEQFLFDTRKGFCEHYATAFVTLMRAAGIPARAVAGYQGGEYNEGGEYLIVRQSDAHAWAEIWLKDRGWVRVDPTAAVAPERIEYGIDAIRRMEQRGVRPGSVTGDALSKLIDPGLLERMSRGLRLGWDAVNLAWFRWTTGYDIKSQLALLQLLGFESPDYLGLVLGMVAGVGLFVIGLLLTLRRTEQHRDPLRELYRRFEHKLATVGYTRRPAEGPLDFAQRVKDERPELESPVEEITASYLQLRYGVSAEVDRKALEQMKKQIAAFRPSIANKEVGHAA